MMMYRLRQLLALAKEYAFVSWCFVVILLAGNTSIYLNLQNTEMEFKQTRLRKDGEAMNRTISAANTLRNDAQMIGSALKEIDASLVAEDNLAENLGYFYIIEDQTHATIGELHQNTPSAAVPEGKYKTVPVTLTARGTYAQVFDFLHKVETGSRQIKITAFTIYRTQATGDAVILDLELGMLAYQ